MMKQLANAECRNLKDNGGREPKSTTERNEAGGASDRFDVCGVGCSDNGQQTVTMEKKLFGGGGWKRRQAEVEVAFN